MKKVIMMVILVFIFSTGCKSIPRQPWTKVDKAMFTTAVAAQGYDYYKTDQAIKDGYRMRSEWQWMYGGDTPSSGTLAASKIVQLGIAWLVLDRVKSKYRKVMLAIMTGGWVWYGSRNK